MASATEEEVKRGEEAAAATWPCITMVLGNMSGDEYDEFVGELQRLFERARVEKSHIVLRLILRDLDLSSIPQALHFVAKVLPRLTASIKDWLNGCCLITTNTVIRKIARGAARALSEKDDCHVHMRIFKKESREEAAWVAHMLRASEESDSSGEDSDSSGEDSGDDSGESDSDGEGAA